MNYQEDYDPLLFGEKREKSLVAVEIINETNRGSEALLFFRHDKKTIERRELFQPFIVVDATIVSDCPVKYQTKPLSGNGRLNLGALFHSWEDCVEACKWLVKKTGYTANSQEAPFLFLNDPVQQHMMLTGRTMFLGLQFEELKRVQVDIECITTQGYEFCNAEREGDKIVAIGSGYYRRSQYF